MGFVMSFFVIVQFAIYAVVAAAFIGGLIYYISRRRQERENETFEKRDN